MRRLRAGIHDVNALSVRNARLRNGVPAPDSAKPAQHPRYRVLNGAAPGHQAFTATLECAVCAVTGPHVAATPQHSPEVHEQAMLEAQQAAAAWVETHHRTARDHRAYRLWLGFPYLLAPGEWSWCP